MKTSGRTTFLAWVSGLICGSGYLFLSSEGFEFSRLIPSLAFAAAIIYSLTAHPEKATPKIIRGVIGPIIAFLILVAAATRVENFGYIVIWAAFLFGSLDAFSQRVFHHGNRPTDHPKESES